MPYRSRTVANRLIQLAREHGRSLTPLQLIKLVYITHGWSLGLLERPLVSEGVEAWRYGPVLPDLYRELKPYGSGPVTRELTSLFDGGEILAPQDDALLRDVFGKYGQLTGIQLSNLTHQTGSPWHQAYHPGEYHISMPNGMIADHYRALANERRA